MDDVLFKCECTKKLGVCLHISRTEGGLITITEIHRDGFSYVAVVSNVDDALKYLKLHDHCVDKVSQILSSAFGPGNPHSCRT